MWYVQLNYNNPTKSKLLHIDNYWPDPDNCNKVIIERNAKTTKMKFDLFCQIFNKYDTAKQWLVTALISNMKARTSELMAVESYTLKLVKTEDMVEFK